MIKTTPFEMVFIIRDIMDNKVCLGLRTTYLGVNTKTKRCCIVKTDGIVSSMSATDYGGSDDIDRTCRLEHFVFTGVRKKYNGSYRGVDYDMGHNYPFRFLFDELWEVSRED